MEKQEKDVLKGLVEEVKALRKEIAPKTYAEKLRNGLSSSTFSFSSPSSFPSSSPSPPSPSYSLSPPTSKVTSYTTSPTSTRGKKK
jgi:hypothetical protein